MRPVPEQPRPPELWRPTPERIEAANLTAYRRRLQEDRGLLFDDYEALWRWSVTDLDAFWASIWEAYGVRSEQPYDAVLADERMPGARWFPGARLNYAEHILRDRPPHEIAIRHASELRPLGQWTWGELEEQAARIATGLRDLGVGEGDRVAAYLPNLPEAVAALLACASLGAVWTSASPDFGATAVVDRFAQLEPKVLLAVDGYRYGGKDFDRRAVVAALAEEMPSVEHVVLLGYLDRDATLPGAVPWSELTAARGELRFAPVTFEHPLWVLYSSGTTGKPKGLVHGHGGILLEQLKSQHLHLDAGPGDRVFWFTTTGWMMWNFLVGALLTGASIVLYEGNPGTPDMGVLWDLAAETGVTTFGTSASFLAASEKAGVVPRAGRDLSALKAVGSTGSPLSEAGFAWVYDQLGPDLWLFSTSGGSDVCTAFVTGNPTLPVHRGQLQCRALGAAVEAWDEAGRPVVGAVGELVITRPLPSMPTELWGDASGERMRDAYFGMYPGVWRHGDWIEIDEHGAAVIHGRSDSTINRGGIRMGTGEIYAAVLALDEIVDALVVDVPRQDGDAWMPLFVVLAPGAELTDDLTRRIARRVREDCSPRHVPSEVLAVDEIPRTLSGKVLEVPVKRILMGADPAAVASPDALANPAALSRFADLARTRA